MRARSLSDSSMEPFHSCASSSRSPKRPSVKSTPLSTSGDDFRNLLNITADRLSPYIESLSSATAFNPPLTATHQLDMLKAPSAGPTNYESLLDDVMRAAMVGIESNSPLHLGYIPSGNLVESALGDLLAKVLNRYVSLRAHGEGLAALEHSLIRWLVSLFGLPTDAHGLLTTGGSMAILSAMVGAREAFVARGGTLSTARIYASDQTHGSIKKAAHFAGISQSSIVKVPTRNGRLNTDDLETAIEHDIAMGYSPMLFCGTAGTTSTGVIEPLDELADLAERYSTWLHVDACYGGFFILTERGRTALQGIDRADSISLDPHKSLFLPSGTGVLLVRHAKEFANNLSPDNRGPYLRDVLPLEPDSWPEFADMGLELTREARCLRLWLPLHRHGLDAFRNTLDEKLDLANYLYNQLSVIPGVEMLDRPDLSIVCCRLSDHRKTERLLKSLTAAKDFLYSSTIVDGRPVLRFCVLQWRTKKEHIDFVVSRVNARLLQQSFINPFSTAEGAPIFEESDEEGFEICSRSSLAPSLSSAPSTPGARTPSAASLLVPDFIEFGSISTPLESDGEEYLSLKRRNSVSRLAEGLRLLQISVCP